MNSRIEVMIDDAARNTLADALFLAQWDTLYDSCHWATPYQNKWFVVPWFEVYASEFLPVILCKRGSGEHLEGLLVLGQSVRSKEICVAGTHHAEYQAWLETGGEPGHFMVEALTALDTQFSKPAFKMRYLPNDVPEAAIQKIIAAHPRVDAQRYDRPLMAVTSEAVSEALRKKHTRNRLNRLKRMGEFSFRKIDDVAEFSAVLETAIPFYDARQGAAHDSYPFQQDQFKKDFHVRLFRECPGLLHVTVMAIDGKPISIHIGVENSELIHVAIVAYDPVLGRLSPGNLHILLLAEKLLEEGKKTIDLTPGGDLWKERFASSHDQVCELRAFGSRTQKRQMKLLSSQLGTAKKILEPVGITPQLIRDIAAKIRLSSVRALLHKTRDFLWLSRELRIYSIENPDRVTGMSDSDNINIDCLSDLLLFEPAEPWQAKQPFLQEALVRLEKGEHLYSVVERDKLLHYGWLIERQETALFSEVHQEYQFEKPGAVLYDFFTDPTARGRGLYQGHIARMLQDAARIYGAEVVYIACLADNHPSRHVIEKAGFRHRTSLFLRRVFGRSRKSVRPGA